MPRVRAVLLDWDKAQANNLLPEPDPRLPTYEGLPREVEGELVLVPVDNLGYTQYVVNGYQVDPSTIEVLDDGADA
ncbi:hypothetical protein [Aciditerrimonas ferrireducens]|uniref:hypothetical protein n=1 Tax=Aciditerrimonas ferrireducens TaxID=667306 RepID=UPI002005A394|nr:hypothetical protein [Aciditerrimonas ferrireducens]MCK4177790.1 hypothetical protein [Aciditerrimonas ferrireducens]